jgi:hypothetical protein
MNQSVPGYEASGWVGVGAPKGTPPEIIERLNRDINAGLSDAIIPLSDRRFQNACHGVAPARLRPK